MGLECPYRYANPTPCVNKILPPQILRVEGLYRQDLGGTWSQNAKATAAVLSNQRGKHMTGVQFRGVEGRDVERDGKNGFNIHIVTRGRTKGDAKFRSRLATSMRFPLVADETQSVKATKIEEDVGPLPGTNRYKVVVWVPSEGLRSAGIGSPLNYLLDELNDRVIDPITGKLMDN